MQNEHARLRAQGFDVSIFGIFYARIRPAAEGKCRPLVGQCSFEKAGTYIRSLRSYFMSDNRNPVK
jgi:hypothetical protein